MTTIEKSVDVHTPVRTVYNQWTQFESFPRFMEGVERITQETPTRTHWRTSIGGVTREFDAEITEQHPDERIAWHTVDGPPHAGVVTFHRLDERTTRVHLQMEYSPETLPEKAGTALGMVSNRIQADLKRFKEFMEQRGQETGGWRGEVPRPSQQGEHTPTQAGTGMRQGANPDFAGEHARPTYADEPSTERRDESVPRGRGGAGGMDIG